MSVDVSATVDSPALPSDGGKPTVEVSFTTRGKTKAAKREVVLCLDTSHSMDTDDEDGVQKLERAKRGAKQVLDELNPDDRLAVVGFDSDPEVAVPLQEWGTTSRGEVTSAIDSLTAVNGTDIYQAIEASWDQFGGPQRGGAVARRIILLSDGQDFRSASTYRSLAADVAEDDVSIVAAGVGTAYDEDVMIALAEGSNGSPVHLTAATDLEAFFEREVAAAGAVVASSPVLHVETGEGFRLEEAFVGPPNPSTTDVSAGDESATIDLPDLTSDSDVTLTARFLAPPRSPGIEYTLADFTLEARTTTAETSVDVEYVESVGKSSVSEDVQVAHADAKVSAGLRDTDVSTGDVREAVDDIARANDDWDDVVDGLKAKLEEAETEDGGAITAGMTKIDPDR